MRLFLVRQSRLEKWKEWNLFDKKESSLKICSVKSTVYVTIFRKCHWQRENLPREDILRFKGNHIVFTVDSHANRSQKVFSLLRDVPSSLLWIIRWSIILYQGSLKVVLSWPKFASHSSASNFTSQFFDISRYSIAIRVRSSFAIKNTIF